MRAFMIVVAIGAIGCSEVTTSSHVESGASLGSYRTYAWADGAASASRGEAEQAVRAALQRELAQRGMVPATEAPPDFIVAYHAERQDKTELTTRAGYRWWGAGEETHYTEGTLVVDFIDPRTDRVFWNGTASSLVDHPSRPNLDRIDKAIAQLMQKYPVPATAAAQRPSM